MTTRATFMIIATMITGITIIPIIPTTTTGMTITRTMTIPVIPMTITGMTTMVMDITVTTTITPTTIGKRVGAACGSPYS